MRAIARRNVGLGRVEERRGGLGLWEPSLRFLSPLIERNMRISRITLSDWLHARPTAYMIGASVETDQAQFSVDDLAGNRAVPRPWTLCRRVRKSRAR